MTIPPIQGIPALSPAPGVVDGAARSEAGFADAVSNALQSVSDAEHEADAIAEDIATGGDTGVHELMISMAKASLSVDLMVQIRNRAVEAYQEIMRMQI